MSEHIDTTHKHLGELAAMSHQTQEAERRILVRAEEMLEQVQKDISETIGSALTTKGQSFMDLIAERGRLQQVIALARKHLAT